MHKHKQSVTLMELLITLVLLSIIIFGMSSMDLFSRAQVYQADRRASSQNEVSIVLEHMAKQAQRAIGNESLFGAETVVSTDNIGANTAVIIYVDSDVSGGPGNGMRDTATDRWIAYRFTGSTGAVNDRFQVRYCPQCSGPPPNPCNSCNPAWGTAVNTIARNITDFSVIKGGGDPNFLQSNSIDIQVTGCWDAPTAVANISAGNPTGATVDNPCVTMATSALLPSVSTH